MTGTQEQAARAAVQLLYSNVDRVVDGRETSGWQLMECVPDVDEDLQERLVGFTRPQLDLTVPLPAFPTPQEVAQADRAMTQAPTPHGTVVAHTAPAGLDTTGRENTMSHVVVLADEATPHATTADLWRSPSWCTPVGAEAVRAAHLGGNVLLAGEMTSEDVVARFATEPGRGAMLAALADALEERLATRVQGREAVDTTVVIPVVSTDEAALWIAALQRTCAPATGRLLAFTTFVRAGSPVEVEALAASELDIACVPREDRVDLIAEHDELILLARSVPVLPAARTPWGVLVEAMTRSTDMWRDARDVMTDVLGFLEDHRDLSPAWPLAMTAASDPESLGGVEGALAGAVDTALVHCQPAHLPAGSYLDSLIGERIAEMSTSDPALWHGLLSAAVRGNAQGPRTSMLAAKYLGAALHDATWLLRDGSGTSEELRTYVSRWSAGPDGRAVMPSLPEQLKETLNATGHGDSASMMRALGTLLADGVVLGDAEAARVLGDAAKALVSGGGRDLIDPAAPHAVRRQISMLVNDLLQGEGQRYAVGVLGPDVCRWLVPVADADAPLVALEVAAWMLRSPQTQREAIASWSRAMTTLAHTPGVTVTTSPQLIDAVARIATPSTLASWRSVWSNADQALAACLVWHPDDPGTTQLAEELLCARRHPPTMPLSAGEATYSVTTSAALMSWWCQHSLFAEEGARSANHAVDILRCAASLHHRGSPLMASRTVREMVDRALVAVALAATTGHRVPVPAALGDFGAYVRERAAQLPHDLEANPRVLLAPGESDLGALDVDAAVAMAAQYLEQHTDADLRAGQFEGAHLSGVPQAWGLYLSDPTVLARAAIQARAGALGEGARDHLHRELRARYAGHNPAHLEAWCDRELLGLAPRGPWGRFRRR